LAHGYSAGPGALPHAVGRKAGWATARKPGPAVEAARACTGVVTAPRPHVGRGGGALTGGGCIEQEERRRGSPKRSSGSGVVGSGRRGGVPVEDGSGGVAASSRVVLRLEAEAREGTAGAALEWRRKHGAGEKNPAGGSSTLLKGGTQRRGGAGSQATRAAERGRESGGPGADVRD
jgi:hypothetical protein